MSFLTRSTPLSWLASSGALLAAGPAGACEAVNADIEAAIEEAHAAFAKLDVDAYTAANFKATIAVGCLTEPITPELAAQAHGLAAVTSFLKEDAATTVLNYRAALAAFPDYEPDVESEGHPLGKAFLEAREIGIGETAAAAMPDGYVLWVDGHQNAERRLELPAVYQLLDAEDQVRWSANLAGDEPLLAPDAWVDRGGESNESESDAPPSVVSVKRVQGESKGPHKLTAPLAIGAGAAAVASVGLFAASTNAFNEYNDPSTPYEDLDALRTRTNSTMTGSGIAAVAAIGLTTVTVAVQF